MKKVLIFFILILFSLQAEAQRQNFWLHGMVRDSIGLVRNAHIVNLNKQKGTFSNDYGQYRIVVSPGDTLEFTSVQHIPIKKVVTDRIAFSKKLNVILENKTYVLDEVVIQRDPNAFLSSDRSKVSKDSVAEQLKNVANVSSKYLSKVEIQKEGSDLATTANRMTDPTKKFEGVGVSSGLGIGSGKRKKAKLNKIISNKFTSQNILDKVGKGFFIKLEIPEDRIFSFIDYCKQFGLRKLYTEDKVLEIMNLLEKKSKIYLELI